MKFLGICDQFSTEQMMFTKYYIMNDYHVKFYFKSTQNLYFYYIKE